MKAYDEGGEYIITDRIEFEYKGWTVQLHEHENPEPGLFSCTAYKEGDDGVSATFVTEAEFNPFKPMRAIHLFCVEHDRR